MDEMPEEFPEAKEARSPRRWLAAHAMTKDFFPSQLLLRMANQVRRLPEWSLDYWWMDEFRRRSGLGEPLEAYDCWDEGMELLDGLMSLDHADRLELVRAESQHPYHTPLFLVVVLDYETETRGSDRAKARELSELVAVGGSTAAWRLMKKNPSAARYLNDLSAVGEARMANVDRITGEGAAWTHSRNARERISPRSDPWCRGEVASLTASLEMEQGDLGQAENELKTADQAFEAAGDLPKAIAVALQGGNLLAYRNQDPTPAFRRCLERIAASGEPERFQGQANHARLNLTLGLLDFHEQEEADSAAALFEQVETFPGVSADLHRRFVGGRLRLSQGRSDLAAVELDSVQEEFGKLGEPFHQGYALVFSAQASLLCGREDRSAEAALVAAKIFASSAGEHVREIRLAAERLAQAASGHRLTLGSLRQFAVSARRFLNRSNRDSQANRT